MKRPVIAYMIRMFPQTSETFIANEILEMERLGAEVQIYSYRRPRTVVPHEYLRLIQSPVAYLPDPLSRHPWELFRANWELRRMEPARYASTAKYVLAHTLRERNPHTWIRFIQAAYLARLLKDSGVQHLHAHFAHGATRVAMLTSMLTGIPYSFTAHAYDIFSDDVNYQLLREKVDQARLVVTVSQYNKDFLNRKIGPLVNGKVHTVYNGVDLQKFSPGSGTEQQDEALILGVGRLIEKKGFSYLIKACRILRDQGQKFTCEIVGGGELRPGLDREIRELGLEGVVKLVGSRSQEELLSYYQRATVLVMPAVVARDGNRDALPTVLLEAMACGTPVVASSLTGIPEIVDHGENGLLVKPGDPTELARAINLLLSEPNLRERFGAGGRSKAEQLFDLKQNTRELYRLISQSAAVGSL